MNQSITSVQPSSWSITNKFTEASAWLSKNSKTMAGSAQALLQRVWNAVSEAFSKVAMYLSYGVKITKDALVNAKDHFTALPPATKVILGCCTAASLLIGGIVQYFLRSDAPVPQPQANATATAPTATVPAATVPAATVPAATAPAATAPAATDPATK